MSLKALPYEAGCRIQTASDKIAFRPIGNSPSDRHFTPVFLLFCTIYLLYVYYTTKIFLVKFFLHFFLPHAIMR